MRHLFFGAAVFAACIVTMSTDAIAQTDVSSRSVISHRIASDGSAVVIVRLDVPGYVPQGRLSTHASRRAQQLAIDGAQHRMLQSLGSVHTQIKRRYRYIPYVAMVVDEIGLTDLSQAPGVVSVQPDLVGRPDVAESRLVVGADIANAAGCDGSGWAVAILDSGVDLGHDAFDSGKIVSEACFSTHLPGSNQESMCPGNATETTVAGSGDDCNPGDFPGLICPHGSLVAGVAAGNDAGGIIGVAPQADIIAVRVFTEYTNGADCPGGATGPFSAGCPLVNASDLMAAIEHIGTLSETTQIAAINISIDMTLTPGGPAASTVACDGVPALAGIKDAVDFTNSLGIPTVASTGNQNKRDRINPPSCLSNVISVGYTQDGSTFDGKGTMVDSIGLDPNRATIMDFWAPGEWITTAWPNNSTNTVRGTSVAAPHVSGALAALRSKGTTSDPDYYVDLLRTTGVMVTDYSPTIDVTKPRIDVGAACEAMSPIRLTAKAFLEGPYVGAGLMSVPGAYKSSIPLLQPFGDPAYNGTPISFGAQQAVVALPPDVVDWVLVELRTSMSAASIVAQQAAFIQTDGDIVDRSGQSVGFVGLDSLQYYVVVRHRNHASVMSASPVSFSTGVGSWDFTTGSAQAYSDGSSPMKDLSDGRFGLFASESNLDGQITAPDFNNWNAQTTAGVTGYVSGDHNLDGIVTAPDFNLWNANTTAGAKSSVPE